MCNLGISSDEDTDAVVENKPAPKVESKPAPKDALKFKLKGGEDTPEEHNKIKALLDTKDKDGKGLILKKEQTEVIRWRHERTAAEVIDYLEKEKAKRTEGFKEDIPWGRRRQAL